MTSKQKGISNQRNAKQSTGPKDPSHTRFNALKHGLYSGQMVLQGPVMYEDASTFEGLLEALYKEKQPVGVLEEFLLDAIAGYTWKLRRVWRYECSTIANGMQNAWEGLKVPLSDEEKRDPYNTMARRAPNWLIPDKAAHERISRSESLYYNSMIKTLREFERLQQSRLMRSSSTSSEDDPPQTSPE